MCKGGPWLASGNSDFGRVSINLKTDNNDPLCLNCLYKQCLWTTHFSSWSLELGTCQAEAACDQPLTKTLGTEFLTSFPGWQHFTCTVTTYCWGAGGFPHDSTGEDSWKPVPGLQTFPFAAFAFYPVAVINHSQEHCYVLSLASESLTLGGCVLGNRHNRGVGLPTQRWGTSKQNQTWNHSAPCKEPRAKPALKSSGLPTM